MANRNLGDQSAPVMDDDTLGLGMRLEADRERSPAASIDTIRSSVMAFAAENLQDIDEISSISSRRSHTQYADTVLRQQRQSFLGNHEKVKQVRQAFNESQNATKGRTSNPRENTSGAFRWNAVASEKPRRGDRVFGSIRDQLDTSQTPRTKTRAAPPGPDSRTTVQTPEQKTSFQTPRRQQDHAGIFGSQNYDSEEAGNRIWEENFAQNFGPDPDVTATLQTMTARIKKTRRRAGIQDDGNSDSGGSRHSIFRIGGTSDSGNDDIDMRAADGIENSATMTEIQNIFMEPKLTPQAKMETLKNMQIRSGMQQLQSMYTGLTQVPGVSTTRLDGIITKIQNLQNECENIYASQNIQVPSTSHTQHQQASSIAPIDTRTTHGGTHGNMKIRRLRVESISRTSVGLRTPDLTNVTVRPGRRTPHWTQTPTPTHPKLTAKQLSLHNKRNQQKLSHSDVIHNQLNQPNFGTPRHQSKPRRKRGISKIKIDVSRLPTSKSLKKEINSDEDEDDNHNSSPLQNLNSSVESEAGDAARDDVNMDSQSESDQIPQENENLDFAPPTTRTTAPVTPVQHPNRPVHIDQISPAPPATVENPQGISNQENANSISRGFQDNTTNPGKGLPSLDEAIDRLSHVSGERSDEDITLPSKHSSDETPSQIYSDHSETSLLTLGSEYDLEPRPRPKPNVDEQRYLDNFDEWHQAELNKRLKRRKNLRVITGDMHAATNGEPTVKITADVGTAEFEAEADQWEEQNRQRNERAKRIHRDYIKNRAPASDDDSNDSFNASGDEYLPLLSPEPADFDNQEDLKKSI